jgi:hypothetical protein
MVVETSGTAMQRPQEQPVTLTTHDVVVFDDEPVDFEVIVRSANAKEVLTIAAVVLQAQAESEVGFRDMLPLNQPRLSARYHGFDPRSITTIVLQSPVKSVYRVIGLKLP